MTNLSPKTDPINMLRLRDGMAAIASSLDAMIVKRPSRKFRLTEYA